MRQVVDFWHSKCKWCPPALEKLNKEAGCADSDDIIFVSCALSQGEGDYEVASNLVTKGYVKVIQLLPTMMSFHSILTDVYPGNECKSSFCLYEGHTRI